MGGTRSTHRDRKYMQSLVEKSKEEVWEDYVGG
jgi:hypothetical protein